MGESDHKNESETSSNSEGEPGAPAAKHDRGRGYLGVILFAVVCLAISSGIMWFFPNPTIAVKQQPPQDEAVPPIPTSGSLVPVTIRQTDDSALLDPRQDGWDSEAWADVAKKQLSKLCQPLINQTQFQEDAIRQITTDDYSGGRLRPAALDTVFQDESIDVLRATPTASSEGTPHRGVRGLGTSLDELSAPLATCRDIKLHIKIVSVDLNSDFVTTNNLFEISGQTDKSTTQLNAVWTCQWARDEQSLRLKSITTDDYEEVVTRGPGGRWFSDCTESVLAGNACFESQLMHGHHYWLQRIEHVTRFNTASRNGLAIGDANGDGLDDLYLCQPPGLPNRLFLQNADGTATDVARKAGVDWLDQTCSALFIDIDNDGDQDLCLGTTAGVLLMENDGAANFALRETLPADYDVQSLSAVDFDNDGDLDLFACVYRAEERRDDIPFLYRDGRGGGLNRLFRQDDAWKFQDVTESVGLLDGADRYSLAAAWEDYDNDGDQDLYVANDFGRNYLYENRQGQFVDVASNRDVTDIGSGMSVSWGDYNRDGLADLYVGNMFSSAGQRVTAMTRFRSQEDQETRDIYARLAKGNSLFSQAADGQFAEVGAEANVEIGRWAWSSVFADINNDGWEDLLVANGYFTTDDSDDL